jgi:hypothetical protein
MRGEIWRDRILDVIIGDSGRDVEWTHLLMEMRSGLELLKTERVQLLYHRCCTEGLRPTPSSLHLDLCGTKNEHLSFHAHEACGQKLNIG